MFDEETEWKKNIPNAIQSKDERSAEFLKVHGLKNPPKASFEH